MDTTTRRGRRSRSSNDSGAKPLSPEVGRLLAPQQRALIWAMAACVALWWVAVWQAGRLGKLTHGHGFNAVVFRILGTPATLVVGGIVTLAIVIKSLTLPPEARARLCRDLTYGTVALVGVSAPFFFWFLSTLLGSTAGADNFVSTTLAFSLPGLIMLFSQYSRESRDTKKSAR